MLRLPGILLVTALLLGPATGQAATAAADSSAGPQETSWLTRNLQRYFGRGDQQAEDLEGEALDIADSYLRHAGKPIEVVIVHQVEGFDESWLEDPSAAARLLTDLTDTFRSNTRDSIIRDYLLFRRGDPVDPFALADSEVMLRSLPYINDVRIVLIPLLGEIESVAVVVETTDRWPIGIDGTVIQADEYRARLYSENVAGTGTLFSNEVLRNGDAEPVWGYRGRVRKENIAGRFLNAELTYEQSFRRHTRKIEVERRLDHPGLHTVGGVIRERTDDFEAPTVPRKFDQFDMWGGEVVRLYDVRSERGGRRPILVPALRFSRRDFLRRPEVTPDSLRGFHDRDLYLAGLTFRTNRYYKTSYLFGDGETEVVPVGMVGKITTGYEVREFQERVPVFLQAHALSVRHRGDLAYLNLDVGGFLRNRKLEDGLLRVQTGYFSPVLDLGSLRHRFYTRLDYTLGLRRYRTDGIFLGDRNGVREMEDNEVRGNQRLVGSLESRVFTRLALLGFRFSFFGFADAGMVGDERASSLFKEKIYLSTGLGLRLRNPSLVLPTVQLQVAFLSNVRTPGLRVAVNVGTVSRQLIRYPGARPGIPEYE